MKPVIWINLDPEKIDLTCLAERLGEKYRLIARAIPGNDPQEVRRQALEADVVISILEKWDAAQLAAVKGRVRLIQKYGMGLDNIDVEEASRLGIYVANVVGANSAAVAETALLHILNAGRKFTPCVSGVKAGVWPSTITGTELDGKIIGLLGCGNIARHLARMLSGFQVEILAYDPYVSQEQAPENVCMVQSREMLFAASDIISLHKGDGGQHQPGVLPADEEGRVPDKYLPGRCDKRGGPGRGPAGRHRGCGWPGCAPGGAAGAGQSPAEDGPGVRHLPHGGRRAPRPDTAPR